MLSLIALWVVLGLAFFAIGAPILSVTGARACLARAEDRIFVSIWMGIVVLANFLLFASLFVPLNLYIAAIPIIVSLSPPLLRKSKSVIADFSISRKVAWLLLAITLAMAFISAFSTDALQDTGAYHHQMVDWLAEYGSVPGLALINEHYGFTSSWFALAAPLQTGMFWDHLIVGPNSFIFVLMILQAIAMLGRVFERHAGIADWFFLFALTLYCHCFFFDIVYSLSPDLPASFLVLVVTWLIIVISINDHSENIDNQRGAEIIVLILASGAIAIKLSVIPLLVVATIYYLLDQGFSLRKLYKVAAISTPFLATLICASIVTTGCALYPAPYFCTDLPWSLGSENARNMSSVIFEFAKWTGAAPADATSLNWIWHDPPNNNVFNDQPLLKWLLIVNVLCGVWLSLRRKLIDARVLLYITLIGLAGIAFTLVKAPHLRFGLSFFLIIPALTGVVILLELSRLFHRHTIHSSKYKVILCFLAVYFTVMPMANTYKNLFFRGFQANSALEYVTNNASKLALWPRPPLYQNKLVVAQGNNFKYLYSEDSVCWGDHVSGMPCAGGKLGNDVWLRDEKAGLAKGFAHVPPQGIPQ